jgi:hypothetical protein
MMKEDHILEFFNVGSFIEIVQEDAIITLFIITFEGDSYRWFFYLTINYIIDWNIMPV